VITHTRIVEAQRRFPRAAGALDYWYRLMKRGRYQNFASLKSAFGSASKVFVRHVLTHAEYDTGRWKQREGLQ
jgi:mRNA interferase HigB